MRCPQCGNQNPNYATQCDCGYRFDSSRGQESWVSRNEGWVGCAAVLVTALVLMWIGGCFVPRSDPVLKERGRLARKYKQFSIIVDNAERGFFRNHLTLNLVTLVKEAEDEKGEDLFEEETKTYTVTDRIIRKYERYVGMVVAAKTADGKITGPNQAFPPGYQYVAPYGHRNRYGHWRGGVWIWYAPYRRYHFIGGWARHHRITVVDYRGFRSSYAAGRAYYGPRSGNRYTFGSTGTLTQRTRPGFYSRYQSYRSSRGTYRSGTRYSRSSRGGWFGK